MLDAQLIDFMTETAKSLGEIKATQRAMKEDITEMKEQCKEIPTMKQSLTNHLSTHDKLKNRLLYPIFVGICITIAGIAGGISKYVLHL